MGPETWLEELGHELTARGVAPTAVAEILVELHGHLQEARTAPLAAFGTPASYAGRLVASLTPTATAPGTRRRHRGPVRLAVEGVSLDYGRRPVLRDVDLEVGGGEVVLLIGPNGVGKTSLLRVIAGLVPPAAGRVRVRGRIGYAPQSGGLLEHLRPDEHFVLFGRPQGLDRDAATREGCRLAAQLGWDAASAPIVADLSGGTRQKLNVVLAGLGGPDVLLLDEPYQGLDRDSTRRFWELLWAWRDAGRAALVVSHAHDAVDRVDAVVELDAGGRRIAA
jgi:ABC-type multidrug transport system ATPase subunit